MSTYKIQGSGDKRTVYDGDRVVGTITQRQREEFRWRISPTSASGRKCVVKWWIATHASGVPVRWIDGRRLCRDTMKEWADPNNWTGRHVQPAHEPHEEGA